MSKRITILSVINDVPHGGDENRLLSFSVQLDRKRFEQRVAILKARDPVYEARNGTLRPEFVAQGVPLVELGLERRWENKDIDVARGLPQRVASFAGAFRRLVRLVRETGVDVLDGHVGTGNTLAVAVGKATRTPVAVTTYHAEFFTPHWLWYPVQQATLRGADAIITDSHQRANTMREFLHAPRLPIEIIPNGIVPEPPRRPRSEVAAEIGIPAEPGTIVVGQIAGMIASKGWGTLVDAAAVVLRQEPKAFFLCIGHERHEPHFVDAMKAKAAALGIGDRMRFFGYHGHNADVWQLFDIHVHASHFDSLPNAIIEGMGYGKPAVVTDVGDCARIIIDGESGFVVPAGDAPALADAILRLTSDPALRARFSAETQRRYGVRHRPEVMTRDLEAVFERLARA